MKRHVKSEKNRGAEMKRSYLIFVSLALILLMGCSGEGYVKVVNDTLSPILVSVNDNVNEVVASLDTSNTYTIPLVKGVVTNVPIEATGTWVGSYSNTAAVTDGQTVIHHISSQVADLKIVNESVDSAACDIEYYDTEYFVGNDSIMGKYTVDGGVDISYYGRYMFLTEDNMDWIPGESYRYELVPNACEIQLNNLHPTWTIYYVYISESTNQYFGEDRLGDDILEPGYGYVWKVDGDRGYDMRVEAGDPHPDSALYVFDYYDVGTCESDFTWIYEFPTIFSPADLGKMAKTAGPDNGMMKPTPLSKTWDNALMPARIEKIKKIDAGKAGLKALRK